jgi:SAM-dependent methyltransferase
MSKLPAFLRPLERAYVKWKMRNSKFAGSRAYWENRYATGGNSGPGSYARHADYKATVMNALLQKYSVGSAIEFGCGDGNQLAMIRYPRYIGLDVAGTAIENCRQKFKDDPTKSFALYEQGNFAPTSPNSHADMGVSLDVLFHLVEEEVYERYLRDLFAAADRIVVIYARDVDGPQVFHERNRSFTRRLAQLAPGWHLEEKIESPFRAEARDAEEAKNVADFFVFLKKH